MSPTRRDPGSLLAAASRGDRGALARLLTMVERGGPATRQLAASAYRGPFPYTIGITGAPGSGKSTLADRLITAVRLGWPEVEGGVAETIDQVGVLAVDPTSPFSGGAILGDRVRMQGHATDPAVFIRSMATRGHLGGLTLAVPDAVRVLGAAGFPVVLVETVGVGQLEVDVASAADTTAVVVTPGWGDAMQANKAGLLEVADILVINKADRAGAREARRDLGQMLELSAPADWRPPIVDTVATAGDGVDELWRVIAEHRAFLNAKGLLAQRRVDRLANELRRVLEARLLQRVDEVVDGRGFAASVREMERGRLDPYEAADRLLTGAGGPGASGASGGSDASDASDASGGSGASGASGGSGSSAGSPGGSAFAEG